MYTEHSSRGIYFFDNESLQRTAVVTQVAPSINPCSCSSYWIDLPKNLHSLICTAIVFPITNLCRTMLPFGLGWVDADCVGAHVGDYCGGEVACFHDPGS